MRKSIIFMFSGQGSQYYQMGKALYNNEPVFRKYMHELDEVAKSSIGDSVVDHIYNKEHRRDEPFIHTLYSNPAIFMVEYSMAKVLLECGIEPDLVMGASLGEFVAAAIAGIADVGELLYSVIKFAQILEAQCHKGGMLAVVHDYNLYYDMPLLYKNTELAAVNFQSHFVISGDKDNLKDIYAILSKRGILCQELPVAYAFHSSMMDPAAAICKEYLSHKNDYRIPEIPFVSSLQGCTLNIIEQLYFWDIVRHPVQFKNAIQRLEAERNYYYLDLGPSGTLSGFVKQNLKHESGSESDAIITPFAQELKLLEKVKRKYNEIKRSQPIKKEKMMVTYMFPGQGCQYKGMGGLLFDEFMELTNQADEILGYSIKNLCLKDPDKKLNDTQYTQPALYVVNAFSYLKMRKDNNTVPDYLAGHSLGEYNALYASGAFDFATGLKLVKKRGELMSQVNGGGMAAVVGLDKEEIEAILKKNDLQEVEIANYNTPSQIVLSGPQETIGKIGAIFEAENASYIPLNVSGAFHSSYMKSLADEFGSFLKSFNFRELSVPVIANVNARPYLQEEIKKNLIDQLANPVRWSDSMEYLMKSGEMEFIEIGPGQVLTNLLQRIKMKASPITQTATSVEKKNKDSEPTSKKVKQSKQKSTKQEESGSISEDKIANERKDTASDKKIEKEPVVKVVLSAYSLGNELFKQDYNIKYAYLVGSMYRGISSKEMVVKVGKAGMMGFLGTGGLSIEEITNSIKYIKENLKDGQAYGMNLLHNSLMPQFEEATVDLYLKEKIRVIEASAFMSATPALVRYRAGGLMRDSDGNVQIHNRIIGKISRPEVAEVFLSPAPDRIVQKLLEEGKVTRTEAELLKKIPLVDDLCVEADSGGHTDGGNVLVLLPSIMRLRDDMMKQYGYTKMVRVGAAGGIGTPAAAVAAFVLGADFIQTGSINQCTVEAGTSDSVKDLLQQINVQDTDYAPAGDMFELGAKVQVLKRGVFFPARANKLYDVYMHHNSLDEIDEKTRTQLQEKFFKKTFNEILDEIKKFYPQQVFEKILQNPKQKMGAVLKWYFGYSTELAMNGISDHQVDYQVHCGPALGSFNQWVKGSPLEDWRNRHVDEIGEKLMSAAAELMDTRLKTFYQK